MNLMCYKKPISIILLVLIIFSCGLLFKPQKARAVVNPLAAISVPIYENGSLPYEMRKGIAGSGLGLDTMGWIAAKLVISTITNSVVNWINSGFEGNPTFVQNPQQFLSDAANQAGGVFIQQLGLVQLCSPYWFPRLKFALKYNVPYLQQMQCTPEMAATNVENFTNNFMNGGWDSWLSMTAYPQNNIWGAYFESSNELARRQTAAATQGQTEASWGQGFISLKKCAEGKNVNDACSDICDNSLENYDSKEECMTECKKNIDTTQACELSGGQMQNTTPGNIIADQLKVNLGSSVRQLEAADEINESLSAIFNALINQLISPNGGLRSLGDTNHGGTGEWQSTSPTTQEKDIDIKIIDNALTYETQYRDIKQSSVNAYDTTIQKLKNLKQCYENKQNLVKAGVIQTEIDNYTGMQKPLQDEVTASNTLISQVEDIKNQILSATSYSQINDLLTQFQNKTQPQLHTGADVQNAQSEYDSIKNQLDQKNNEIDTEYNRCLSGTI